MKLYINEQNAKLPCFYCKYSVEAEIHDHDLHYDVIAPCAWSNDDSQTWRLEQFHWHWGGSEVVGSEHTVDKDRFPMEVINGVLRMNRIYMN